jgi:hypothetical protein
VAAMRSNEKINMIAAEMISVNVSSKRMPSAQDYLGLYIALILHETVGLLVE